MADGNSALHVMAEVVMPGWQLCAAPFPTGFGAEDKFFLFQQSIDQAFASGGVNLSFDGLVRKSDYALKARMQEILVKHYMKPNAAQKSVTLDWIIGDGTSDHCAMVFTVRYGTVTIRIIHAPYCSEKRKPNMQHLYLQ